MEVARVEAKEAEDLLRDLGIPLLIAEKPLEGFHIVVDAGNGAGGFFTAKVLEPLGAVTTGSQFLEPDGLFPNHIPNPEDKTAMKAITQAVLDKKADLGIIFDTDVDRSAAVDSTGREFNRNRLIALMSAIVLEEHPRTTIVTDSVTSDGLTTFIEKKLGGKHHRFKRGYKNVIDEAIRLNSIGEESHLAIETSGHGALRENHWLDDGAYLMVKILNKLASARASGMGGGSKVLTDLVEGLQEAAVAVELRLKINQNHPDLKGGFLQILEWEDIGVANLAGVISLLAGLLMWVTSLHPVRKHKFELFFYTHQLFVIFVVFLALHVGDFIFSMAAGGIFLFILDRFLRFCQSRRTVDIISAKCLPCGTVELILSKPRNLRYNALSFVFLQVRGLSWLQWHPFSVSSSPLDGKYHLSILIKVLGEWTEKLRGNILNSSEAELHLQPQKKITASVEGPYGHELPYHLMYENLILVAGGIGISPFLAILSDILHRIRDRKPCLPRNLLIVWAVKRSNEIPLLFDINMESICPFFSDKLNLDIRIYVTRESQPPLEEGNVHEAIMNSSHSPVSVSDRCSMSVLVGTGNNIWSGLYVISSTLGFVILIYLLDIFYINPFGISSWWYKGLLFIICMLASVFIFGGLVIGLWHLWERRIAAREACEDDKMTVEKIQHNETVAHKDSCQQYLANSTSTYYGSRPEFDEIFGDISEKWGSVDVGVIVCGPPTLQSSVAKEIRSQNIRRQRHHPIFHFNSHSFDL